MNFPTGDWRQVKKNSGIFHPLRGQPFPPFSKTRSISANYESFSTKFSGIRILARCPGMGQKNLENVTPFWGPPTPPYPETLFLGQLRTVLYKIFSNLYTSRVPKKRQKDTGKCHPSWAPPPPPVSWNTVKYLISLAITSKYRWNFQELVNWLGDSKSVKNTEICYPHLGQPQQPQPPQL